MRHRLLTIAFLLLGTTTAQGCRPTADNDQPPLKSDTIQTASTGSSNWLVVSGDSNAIQQAIELQKRTEDERFQHRFRTLSSPFFIDTETIELLERRRAEAVLRLNQTLPKEGVTDEAVGATVLLCRLGEVSGRAFASRIFLSGTATQRRRLLNDLDSGIYDDTEKAKRKQFLFADPRLAPALLQQLDDTDPEVVKAAVQSCGMLQVPGVNDRFLKLLKRRNLPDADRVLYWLSQGELNPEVFEHALRASRSTKSDHSWGTEIFEKFAKQGDEPLKSRAQDHLRDILKTQTDGGKMGYRGDRLGMLTALAESADSDDLPWLKPLAESESGLYAASLLAAWIRLEPQTGRETWYRWLAADDRRRTALSAVGTAFSKTGDSEIVERLAGMANVAEGRELTAICTALNSVGGKAAQEVIEKMAPKLDPADLAQFRQSGNHVPLAEILEAVQAAEILSADEGSLVTQHLSSRKTETDEESDLPDLFTVLVIAKAGTAFDVETGMLPCRHDQLVDTFADSSRGKFTPAAVHETWHQKNDEDMEAAYTLQFVMNNRLYRGEIRNMGDWYDVERVVAMINKAVEDAGHKETFLGLASDGQMASFVFADPEKLAPVARRFHMPLSQDLGEARKKGVEFEESVINSLQNQ